MIQIVNGSVAYGDTSVLRGVHASVAPGECIGIIGPNGSGKTTLLKLMSGELKAQSGEVIVCGRPIGQWSAKERARLITVVTQEGIVPVPFSVYDVVMMGRHPHRRRFFPPSARDRQVVARALEATGLNDMAHKPVAHLSGGERQRVAVARAMAQEPQILLLDEPTTYLDIGYQLTLLQYVWDWRVLTGASVVTVLHDLNLAAQFCERMLMMDRGRIVADGTPEDVLQKDRLKRVYRTSPHLIRHPTRDVPQVLLSLKQ